MPKSVFRAIGLMSGTSLDGIDVALIETDGQTVARFGPGAVFAYSEPERAGLKLAIKAAMGWPHGKHPPEAVTHAADLLTLAHARAVEEFLAGNGLAAREIDVVGFHGQTVLHEPKRGRTIQIGHGQTLADRLGIDVVANFREADVAAGGEGAPFAPAYHRALVMSAGLELPVAVLNLGGVGNFTFVGADGALVAFDTGPGNGPLDEWVEAMTGASMDRDGALAASGTVNAGVLASLIDHPFFAAPPPKSLDRYDFTAAAVRGLSAADGAATLTAFTAATVREGLAHLPVPPKRVIVCGGGRHNPALLEALRHALILPVETAEAVGWRGDTLEAEAFAFLAVRALKGLPLSFPGTTGVEAPMTGGVLYTARETV